MKTFKLVIILLLSFLIVISQDFEIHQTNCEPDQDWKCNENDDSVIRHSVIERKPGEDDLHYRERVDEYKKRVEAYWTPERMREAKPVEIVLPNDD